MTELDPRYAATAGLEMALDLPAARQGAARVRAHAEEPANVYLPALDGSNTWAPGTDPRHVFETGSHRVTYAITRDPEAGTLYRQAWVSLMGGAPGKHPTPPAVFTIATLLGFTGGEVHQGITIKQGDDWGVDAMLTEEGMGVIVMAQVFSGGA